MAALAPVVDKIEDVPEPARQFYVAKEGKFHVDLTAAPAGFVSAAELAIANGKVIEFRDNNVLLTKKVGELEPIAKKFEGIDADAAKNAIAAQDALKKAGIGKPDDVTALINSAVQNAVKPLTDQITTITTAATEDKKRADALMLSGQLGSKFSKAGGVPEAHDYIVSRAQGVFVVEGGAIKAAPNQFSADRPGEPLTMDEWMTRMTKEAAFAFKPSGGGGANPQTPGAAGGRPAGQLVLTNPTPQQLGEHGKAIREGKMRVEYTTS